MTEPSDSPEATGHSPPSAPGEAANVLDTFKAGADGTDNDNVHDAIGGRPRLDWSPVTDGGGRAPTETDERSSFHFDLGGALARLGEEQQPKPPSAPATAAPPAAPIVEPPPPVAHEPLPQRATAAEARVAEPAVPVAPPVPVVDAPLPQREAVPTPPEPPALPLEPLPRRGERPAPEAPSAPAPVATREASSSPYVSSRRSVFDDAAAAGTTMPPSVRPPATPIVPPPAMPAVGATAASPTLPPVPSGPLLPTLPPPTRHVAPMYTPPIDSAPSTPDINAFRSAQLRASRQQRKGKLFSRTMLVLLVIGLVVAGALHFGRKYLFPTEWDASLTPIVDDIQNDRGVEFDHTVGLVKQPPADYALTIGRLVVDDSWLARVPVWRALGLTTGEPTADGISPALAAARPAVYDADADRIYMSAEASPESAAPDLRLALEQAFAAQHGDHAIEVTEAADAGFLGVSPMPQIVHRAVERYLAERESAFPPVGETAPAPLAIPVDGDPAALPLPIEYELTAVDELGQALLSAAGIDPATVRFGTPLPDNVGAALDDRAQVTSSGALQVGDRSLAPPTSLGVDDWSLVWGSRLPQSTVERLAAIVVADSYRPIDRGGVICAIAVFATGDPTDAATVLAAMQTWVAAAPAGAQSAVVQLGDRRIQLSACDPGAEAAGAGQPGSVAAVINRQLTRLAG